MTKPVNTEPTPFSISPSDARPCDIFAAASPRNLATLPSADEIDAAADEMRSLMLSATELSIAGICLVKKSRTTDQRELTAEERDARPDAKLCAREAKVLENRWLKLAMFAEIMFSTWVLRAERAAPRLDKAEVMPAKPSENRVAREESVFMKSATAEERRA